MGRSRRVPEAEALEQALQLFWKHGYDRTSIAHLSEAIGVGPSSIYNAFGSKQEIYQRAITMYMETHAGFVSEIFLKSGEIKTEDSIRELLRGAVLLYTSQGSPSGCAMFQSSGAGEAEDSVACAFTLKLKTGLEDALLALFTARERAGDSLSNSPELLAKFVLATMHGISQLACDGSNRKTLMAIADHTAKSCITAK